MADVKFGSPVKIEREVLTLIGYPIIEITKKKVGRATQRIIGWVGGGKEEHTEIDTYEAKLTDSQTKKIILKFQVTRDAFAVKKSDYSAKKLILSNFGFEPKDAKKNWFRGNYMIAYPYKGTKNDTPAIKLTQHGSEVMHAHPNEDAVDLGYRDKKDVTAGIMIHVGGYYYNESLKRTVLAASEGCFGIVNSGNSKSNTSDDETKKIMSKILEMSKKSTEKPNYILIIIRKRESHEIPNKIEHIIRP